jgi:hypothetical protein
MVFSTISRWVNSKKYNKIMENKNKIERYKGHLSAKETQLNDILRKLISSVKGFSDAEKIINKSSIHNVGGFLNNIKHLYPKVYSSGHFWNYEKQIVKLEKEITHERIMVNRHISLYNIALDQSPILAKTWNLKKEEIINWNTGRDVKIVSEEYNKANQYLKF